MKKIDYYLCKTKLFMYGTNLYREIYITWKHLIELFEFQISLLKIDIDNSESLQNDIKIVMDTYNFPVSLSQIPGIIEHLENSIEHVDITHILNILTSVLNDVVKIAQDCADFLQELAKIDTDLKCGITNLSNTTHDLVMAINKLIKLINDIEHL
jgi:hypothetical protein